MREAPSPMWDAVRASQNRPNAALRSTRLMPDDLGWLAMASSLRASNKGDGRDDRVGDDHDPERGSARRSRVNRQPAHVVKVGSFALST